MTTPQADAHLIDGNNLLHRCYHALRAQGREPDPPMIADATDRTIRAYINAVNAPRESVLVVFDGEGGTAARRAIYPAYKGQRGERSGALTVARHGLMPNLDATGIMTLRARGWEADDQIASLVATLDGERHTAAVLTSDKDLWQLLGERCVVVNPKRQPGGSYTALTDAAFRESWGFAPPLLADYKALTGDPSDNIAGIPGIGDKTAKAVIAALGGIEPDGPVEGIYAALANARASTVKVGVRARLREHEYIARRNLSITRLVRDIPARELASGWLLEGA